MTFIIVATPFLVVQTALADPQTAAQTPRITIDTVPAAQQTINQTAPTPSSTLTPTQQTAAQTATAQANGQPTDQGCGIMSGGAIGTCFMYLFSLVAWGIFFLAGRILFLAGMLLDYSIKASVLLVFSQNGTFASTLSDAINTGWGVLRDVANIFFIFILLYAGIKLIIGQEDHPGAVIKNVVIMAFLINFSLLFTKIAIDASNIVALVFYKILVPDPATGSISSLFLNGLMLNSVFNNAGLTGSSYYWLAMISYLMAAVVAILAAWVFLSAAITFVIRTVTLLILMIVSPLAFVFYTFPGKEYKGKWNEWLGKLTENCVIAPAYLFLIWICAYIINAMLAFGKSTGTTTGGLGAAFSAANQVNTSDVSTYTVIFIYAIVIGLIWASLSVSKSLSKSAQGMAGSIVGAAAGFALGGVGGSLLRNTLGRGAGKLAGSEGFKDFASKSRVGAMLYKGTKATSKGSMDFRNSTLAGKIKSDTALDLGKGTAAGSYSDRIDKASEARVKFANDLGYNKADVKKKEDLIKEKQDRKDTLEFKAAESKRVIYKINEDAAAAGRARTADEIETVRAHTDNIAATPRLIEETKSDLETLEDAKVAAITSRKTNYKNALSNNTILRKVLTLPRSPTGKASDTKAATAIDNDLKLLGLEDELKDKSEDLAKNKVEIKRLRDKEKGGRVLSDQEKIDLNNAIEEEYKLKIKVRELKIKISRNKKEEKK